MKYLSLSIFIFLITIITKAQTTYPEPDFANVPVWYDNTSKVLKNFERLPVNKGTRMSGPASAETYIVFAGETSTTQFQHDQLPTFIVKLNSPTEDPSTIVELGKLQINKRKHQREYIAGKGGLAGGKSTLTTLSLDFKKLSPGVYQFAPSQTLEPGEYVISSSNKAFLFTVLN